MRIIDNEYDRKEHEENGTSGRMKFVKFTPELAQKYLANNSINRPLNRRHIERFIDIIKSGLWMPGANVFQMARNGKLLNGQHRLTAIVESGVTVYAWVCFDLAEKVYNAIDTEIKRRAIGDLLPKGTLCRMNIGAITNAIWNVKYNRWPELAQKSLELFYEYQSDIEWAWATFQPKVTIFSAGVIGAFAYAHSAARVQKKVEKFAEELVTGIGREPGAVSIVLERSCIRTPKLGASNRRNIQRKVLRAIQFYCEGKQAVKLQETLEGVNYFRKLLDEKPITDDSEDEAGAAVAA